MLTNNLLMSELSAGLFVFIMGLLVVFLGIAIIVTVISIIGTIMKRNASGAKKRKDAAAETVAPVSTTTATNDDGVSDEVKAAITAVIAAYFMSSGSGCEFTVRKIKKI